MNQAFLSIVTVPFALAAGQKPASFVLSIAKVDGSEPQSQTLDAVTGEVEFDNLTPGDYTGTAARQDTTGANIGTPATFAFSVAAETADSADIPQTVTVRLAVA